MNRPTFDLSLARVLGAMVLAVLLSMVQQGMLRHELSHVEVAKAAEEGLRSASPGTDTDTDTNTDCELCHAFAAVGGLAVWRAPAPTLHGDLTFQAPALEHGTTADTLLPSPRSRGPPLRG